MQLITVTHSKDPFGTGQKALISSVVFPKSSIWTLLSTLIGRAGDSGLGLSVASRAAAVGPVPSGSTAPSSRHETEDLLGEHVMINQRGEYRSAMRNSLLNESPSPWRQRKITTRMTSSMTSTSRIFLVRMLTSHYPILQKRNLVLRGHETRLPPYLRRI